MEYRRCKRCGEVKPLTKEYWHLQGRKNQKSFRIVCRKCANKQTLNRSHGILEEYKEAEVKRVKFILETQKPKYPFTSYAAMTKDKVYEVIRVDNDCYTLKDDAGKVVRLNKARFKIATIDEMLRSEFE